MGRWRAPHGPGQARRWAQLQAALMRAVPARAAWMAAPGPGAAGGAAAARGRARSQPRHPGPAPSCHAAAERDAGRAGRGGRGAAGGRGGGSGRGGGRRCAWARFEHGALQCSCPCLPAAKFGAPSSTEPMSLLKLLCSGGRRRFGECEPGPAAQRQVSFTAPFPTDPVTAIIGGGLAGLACAHELAQNYGLRSVVFDTGV